MNSQIEELKNQISNLQKKHYKECSELKQHLDRLEKSQAKPSKGLIKDPKYIGDCFFLFSDGVVLESTTSAFTFALNQGRAFYDLESAKRFREHERLQYELACATESGNGDGLHILLWNTERDYFFIGYYSKIYARFGFKSRTDAEDFASNYTSKELKLMLGVGL
jgi:hypothetical protein